MALSFARGETLWLRKVGSIIGCSSTEIRVAADNRGALALSHNEIENNGSKHIDANFQFIQDHLQKGAVSLKDVPSVNMICRPHE